MNAEEKVDFTIVSKPDYISFECPHCKNDIRIEWDDVDEPESWADPWGCVECSECGKTVELGEYDYD